MGSPKCTLSEEGGLKRIAAGFIMMTCALFVFIVHPMGIIVFLAGFAVFLSGYYRWCPIRAVFG